MKGFSCKSYETDMKLWQDRDFSKSSWFYAQENSGSANVRGWQNKSKIESKDIDLKTQNF